MKKNIFSKRVVYVFACFLILFLTACFVSCSGSGGGGTTPTVPDVQLDDDAAVSENIEPSTGGIVETSTGHKLEIPPGALQEAANITVTPYTFPDDPEFGAFGGVKLEPSGLQFNSEVTLTIKLSTPFPAGTRLQLAELVDAEAAYVDLGTMFTVSDSGLEASGPIYSFSEKILWKNCHAGTRDRLMSTWTGNAPGRGVDVECISDVTGLTVEKLTHNDPSNYDNFDASFLGNMLTPYFYECFNFPPGEDFTSDAESYIDWMIDEGLEVVMLFGPNITTTSNGPAGFAHSTWVVKEGNELRIRGQINLKDEDNFLFARETGTPLEVDYLLSNIDDKTEEGMRDIHGGEVMRNYINNEGVDHDAFQSSKIWSHVSVYCEKVPDADEDDDCLEDTEICDNGYDDDMDDLVDCYDTDDCDCVPIEGACCSVNGTCDEKTEAECEYGLGEYHGNDTTCSEVSCLQPEGACCGDDLSCSQKTRDQCVLDGGSYEGDFFSCTPNPCSASVGACCSPYAVCYETGQDLCESAGHTYLGTNSSCAAENPCPDSYRYYVFKTSGSGYRKMWGGWANKMTGNHIHYRYIQPSELEEWENYLGDFDQATANACEGGPALCPCAPWPDIWVSGTLEIVTVVDTAEELDAYRCDTPHYGGDYVLCNGWSTESAQGDTFWGPINGICGE